MVVIEFFMVGYGELRVFTDKKTSSVLLHVIPQFCLVGLGILGVRRPEWFIKLTFLNYFQIVTSPEKLAPEW